MAHQHSSPHSPHETIAAIATAPGAAGLAVLRVSGTGALAIADAVFRGTSPLAASASHVVHHGWAHAGARRLDEVVAAVFRTPRSYTGEDVVELSCHGGRVSGERVLAALLAAGARLAKPGEFTQRAFLNGRIDLAQAEAVADVIHAETEAAHELALDQLAGSLSRRLDRLADGLTDALAEVEARVDFAEDVGGIEVPPHVVARIAEVRAVLDELLSSAIWGRAMRDGVRVPLVGRPNVGKSSLFNALVGEERAIVTALPGTTRDRVSESIELCGARVMLSDTAGLRETADTVEAIGIERTLGALEESRAALWVVDGAVPLDAEDARIARSLAGKRVLVALNKRDLGAVVTSSEIGTLLERSGHDAWRHAIAISAVRGEGITELRAGLARLIGATDPSEGVSDGVDCGGDDAARDAAESEGNGNTPHRIDAGGNGAASLGVHAGDIGTALMSAPAPARGAVLSNPRHVDALRRASEALVRAQAAGEAGMPGEIVALELRESLAAIGEVTGRSVDEDVLDRIFSRFCIGK